MESAETAAPAASIEEKREQTKKALVPLPDSISDLLNGGRVTDAFNRHCLTFTAMELTAIAESSLMSDGVGNNNIDMNIWLDKLLELANELDSYLAWHRLADPNAHEDLLQKALRCFRPIHGRYDDIRWAGYRLHLAAKYPCRSVIVPPPPHAAELEAGDRGGYLVGKKKLLFKHNDDLRLSSLYLSLFAQENVFEKEHLYMKWQSEGLTQTADTNCEEEDNCFSELVNWNIITPVAENCGLNLDEDHLCQWQLNPFIVEDLASKAAEKGFVFTGTTLASPEGGDNRATIPIRRLALHLPDPQIQEMLEKMDLDHIRSLLISGAIERITIPLEKFAYLVVLDIQGWENLDNEDLLKICKMFMLSYLSIRRTRVTKLPPQIKDLHILRTLDISCTQISELPPEVCNLSMLRVLDLRGTKIGQLPEQIARLHNSLKTLLIGGYGMITNSNETVIETEIPHKLITVVRLRTLAIVDLSECPASFVEVLGYQDTLWVLVITWSFHQCVDGAYRSALLSSIRKWRNLRSLTIHCGLGCSMEFLDSLDHPSAWLEKFKVTAGRFLSVPQWIKGLAHLTFLQITVCRLVPDDVKILADLIKLECLVLGLEFIPEKEIVIERDGFNELQRFSLDCPVPWLTFKQGAMPKLTYLKLKICSGPANQVSAVPSGLSNLRRITEVFICYSKWCSESSSIKRTVEAVRKQVGKHLNPIDLVINGIQQDIEAFDEGTEEATGSGTQDDVEAADEETVRTTTQIGNEIEEI